MNPYSTLCSPTPNVEIPSFNVRPFMFLAFPNFIFVFSLKGQAQLTSLFSPLFFFFQPGNEPS